MNHKHKPESYKNCSNHTWPDMINELFNRIDDLKYKLNVKTGELRNSQAKVKYYQMSNSKLSKRLKGK